MNWCFFYNFRFNTWEPVENILDERLLQSFKIRYGLIINFTMGAYEMIYFIFHSVAITVSSCFVFHLYQTMT